MRYLASKDAQSILGRKLKGVPALKSAKEAFIHNDFGIAGCEAFLYQMPIAAPEFTTTNSFVIAELNKWGEKLEQLFGNEYDRQYKALPRENGVISQADYNKFVAHMGTFIENTTRTELSSLDINFKEAFARGTMPPAGFASRIVWPGIILLLLTAFLGFYVFWVRKNSDSVKTAAYRKNNAAGYLCISPWVMGFICFSLLPVIAAIAISMTDWNMIRPANYVGLRNYTHLIHDQYFLIGMAKTFKYAAMVIPISLLGRTIYSRPPDMQHPWRGFFQEHYLFPLAFCRRGRGGTVGKYV